MANPMVAGTGGSPLSIYSTSTEKYHEIGTRAQLDDGRVFYFAENTSANALAQGKLMVRPNIVTNHHDQTNNTLVVGSKNVTFTPGATAVTADQYAEGFLAVTDGTGEGRIYKVKSHPAADSATAFVLTLYDEVDEASAAATTLSLVPNGYRSPQISVADQLDIPVGVPTTTIAAGDTTPQYGWIQTWGEAVVLADEAVAAIAQAMTIGSSVAGAVEEDDTATTVSQEFIVGYNVTPMVDTEYQVIDLRIRP